MNLAHIWDRVPLKPVLAMVMIAVLALLVIAGVRAEVRVKSVVDHGSQGVDNLNSAYRQIDRDDAAIRLVMAAQEFGEQKAGIDHWGWAEAVSKVIPPLGRQFRALRAINRAGLSLAAAPMVGRGSDVFGGRGTRTDLCSAAADLDALGGGLYRQFVKTRTELKALILDATGGRCGR